MIEEVHKRGGTNNCNDPEVPFFETDGKKAKHSFRSEIFFHHRFKRHTSPCVSRDIFFSLFFSLKFYFLFFFKSCFWTFSESSKFLSLSFLLFDFF